MRAPSEGKKGRSWSGGLWGGGVGMGARESFLISFSPHVYISPAGSALQYLHTGRGEDEKEQRMGAGAT